MGQQVPFIATHNLNRGYYIGNSHHLAISDISIHVCRGEFVSIIGPSGCGKSTLLEIIAGLLVAESGTIEIEKDIRKALPGEIGYMPQDDMLFPWRTVIQNVVLPLRIRGIAKQEAYRRANALLPRFGLLPYANVWPDQLSGGMRQRAAFLRTCLTQSDLILLDEPFGRLDALTRVEMQNWLLDIWSDFGFAVFLVTHDIEEAILLSDRIYVMSAAPGRIVDEIIVPFSRPRKSTIREDDAFLSLKNKLLQSLSVVV